jgi:hypothetical protein
VGAVGLEARRREETARLVGVGEDPGGQQAGAASAGGVDGRIEQA